MNVHEWWALLEQLEVEEFHQIRNKAFTSLTPNGLTPSTPESATPKSHFAEALALLPLRNTVPVQQLYGPSNVYVLLSEPRVREWHQ